MSSLSLLLVPSIIVGVSVIERCLGPHAAGKLSSLPILAGPVLWIIARTHGPAYGAEAAATALSGVAACAAYGVVYDFVSRRAAWPTALSASLLAWTLCAATSGRASWSLSERASLAVLALWGARFFLSSSPDLPPRTGSALALIGRVGGGAVLVSVVYALAERVGPEWSGLLSAFPMLTIVLSVSNHRDHGHAYVATLLRAMLLGFPSFAAFCFVIAACLPRAGLGVSFATASVAAVGVRLTLEYFERAAAKKWRRPLTELAERNADENNRLAGGEVPQRKGSSDGIQI